MIELAIGFWTLLNLLLFIFVAQEFSLLGYAILKKRRNQLPPKEFVPTEKVIVQLPVYNEKYVVERLLKAVSQLNYPNELLEVQILDDSTDETSQIIANFISDQKDFRFSHIQRPDRRGFKAGALAYGMEISDGKFFAIFDADFIPDPEFLMRTMPYFSSEKTGVVQTRWGHINEDFSIITKAQGVMLDAHFGVEQKGRSNAGGFINFNGTAGVWRRVCIEDAGGWQADTLTEDLDLSFRAQALNWKIEYRFETESPAELPLTFNAFRNQQFRWSKGAAECFRKNVEMLWKAPVKFSSKLIGTFHLLNSSVYILILGLMVLAPFIYFLQTHHLKDAHWLLRDAIPFLGLGINLLLVLIFLGGKLICSDNRLKTLIWFIPSLFFFFSISLGISVHMVLGVLNGYRGRKTEFVRTPKFGKNVTKAFKKKNNYGFKSQFNLKIIEGVLLLYGLFWVILGIKELNVLMISYSLIIITGFSVALFLGNSTLKPGFINEK